jgi:hypothetical protein
MIHELKTLRVQTESCNSGQPWHAETRLGPSLDEMFPLRERALIGIMPVIKDQITALRRHNA